MARAMAMRWPLTTGKFMRITVDGIRRQADIVDRLFNRLLMRAGNAQRPQWFGDDRLHLLAWVERGIGILKTPPEPPCGNRA